MAKTLTQEDLEFRKFVKKHDGYQQSIADELGISVRALQFRLFSEKHSAWWLRFKANRSDRRRKARNRRRHERVQARNAERILEINRAYGGGPLPGADGDPPSGDLP